MSTPAATMGRRKKGADDRKPIELTNKDFETYYETQGIFGDEWNQVLERMRQPLPTTFRIAGSKNHAKDIQKSLESDYFPEIGTVEWEGVLVEAPKPIPWYPDGLAYQVDVDKKVIRKFPPFRRFQEFLVCEAEAGNVVRQEAVSMIPVLFLDAQPNHRIIDMCASPGSKTSQIVDSLAADVWPEGVVIANDSDYKRCYMLIHNVKRLHSPSLLVTNHDASNIPNFKVNNGNEYELMKFDRVLADVPCSGDGTLRKNLEIWKSFTINSGYGLHPLQVRILFRGLQLLAVGGRLVYSTCSLNPIEDEAVVAEGLRMANGSVALVDVSEQVPLLKRSPGLTTWKVLRKDGTEAESDHPRSVWPPSDETITSQLKRCIRVSPHLQNTGGFFVAVLEKVKALDGVNHDQNKRFKSSNGAAVKVPDMARCDESFTFISEDNTDLLDCRNFFQVDDSFPISNHFVRSQSGQTARSIYFCNSLVRNLLSSNDNTHRILSGGIRLYTKQSEVPKGGWRLTWESLPLINRFLGDARIVKTESLDTIKTLICGDDSYPRFDYFNEDAFREACRAHTEGSIVVRFTHDNKLMLFPLWRNPQSVNAMVPKLDRRAISMQLFGKDFTMEQEKIAAETQQKRMNNREVKLETG